jgi:hypothetical protein
VDKVEDGAVGRLRVTSEQGDYGLGDRQSRGQDAKERVQGQPNAPLTAHLGIIFYFLTNFMVFILKFFKFY